ncbi:T9SS outer membrane translocon Sov/SprA [Filimonas effusa]|uniref:Cell surface protein SprA n=1 Tax=Filimonas effusa TaxID=2508721 RepID=A0A4Q1D2F0_9BACT|nr:cell surface protein SprA [Filimonas effusa]RXK81397.1 cell surface protein SprA [Filimonas effusa]
MCLLCMGNAYSQQSDSLRFPLQDRRGDPFTAGKTNPFDIKDSAYVKRSVEYDPKTKQYYIVEKIGNSYYRKPTYLTYEEFWRIRHQQAESEYFSQRAQTLFDLNKKVKRPPMQLYPKLFDRIFGVDSGGLKVNIRPQGNVDLLLGYQGQSINNPTLPERARKTGGFDFDMNANLNVMGNIGNKLKLPINYNTLANFDFENQIKLDYKGMDDEIIRSIEAGNISFQTKGTLMSSVQSLFGIKTQLQFGRLGITTALANNRSQKQSLGLQGGGIRQNLNKKLDDYEENKHFLLGQYFRTNYNKTMSNLPIVTSQVQILRMEVWVTNRTGSTTDTRYVAGLMDLGENAPYNNNINSLTQNTLPQNGANDLYSFLVGNQSNRNPNLVSSLLQAKGLRPVTDFEKTFARKLNSSEYYFNPQAGFLSLNQQLQSDQVLGVAYQYTYNGRVYQVGEFSQDVAVDSTQGVQKVLFLKLLKATSQRVNLPIWGLMMKNVYSLDVTGLQQADFKLNVLYQEPSGGYKRFLPESAPNVEGRPLLSILNLDRLNSTNAPMPDGVYDYVEGFTVLSQQGKIIFPVLEPFGRDLDTLAFAGQPQELKNKYVFYQLYDSIKAIAQTYANVNRYVAQGSAKGSASSDIYLGAFNVPQGSVKVTAGGQVLRENVDYIIDYNQGSVRVINQAIINSGVGVNVEFENNASFGLQQRSFMGLRLDYALNKKLSLGATYEKLSERPFFTKVNYGEDPINNSMYGIDFNYRSEAPGLTRLLNKLPFYNTTAMSAINAYGEAAVLKPGHAAQIGTGQEGAVYIDDFEGSTSNIDIRFPTTSWVMASTPSGNGLFPEASLNDSVDYGKNRAKLAWYNIEPILQDRTNINNPLRSNPTALSDPRVRAVYTNELFPQRTTNITDVQTTTFDLAYYPTEKGPYNFSANPADVNSEGKLLNPRNRWGGIMRSVDQTDFETSNIGFVEFWVQDPFITNPSSTGGKMFLNLGDISEDVLKDGRRFYENGLSTPSQSAVVDSTTTWGKTPINPIQVTQAFSNDPNDRTFQDVGFDGLDDEGERRKRSKYINDLAVNFTTASTIYRNALIDPSSDNYKWYRDETYDASGTGILGRYKQFNNPQGNSPVANNNSQFSPAATLYPDNEDLNRDNTLNENEDYYEYEIDVKPGMDVGVTKYITDKRVITPKLADGTTRAENWYLFRVPVSDYTRKIGSIPDFKSIRFLRMYLTGFEDSVVLRFAKLDLVRNQWRIFAYDLDTTGSYRPVPNSTTTVFDVLAVNLEENSSRQPVPYRIPPGIERVQMLSNNGVNLLQNEQSMSLKVRNLVNGDSRSVFKTMNLDMRQYGRMSMFIHAESVIGQTPVINKELNAVIRIGQDFLNNYYEIRVPLQITPPSVAATAEDVWPTANNLDFSLQELVKLKLRRNNSGAMVNAIYREQIGDKTFSVLGNPNLAEVNAFLVGVENANDNNTAPLSAEVWFDELRLSQIDEKGGWAALGRIDVQLADLGTMSVSANTYSTGWGSIEQKTNERARESMMQFDAAIQIDAGKLLPQKAGITIPVYASINRTVFTPEYDPYNLDVKLKDVLNAADPSKRDSIKSVALDQTIIKTLNFTNVRFGATGKKPRLWSISNFDFSYSYTLTEHSNPLITKNNVVKHRGGFGYTYNDNPHFIEPFKRLIKTKSRWLALLTDFNFNLTPSLLGFRADVNRQFGMYIPRIVNTYDNKVERVDTTYDKYFTFDRYYNFRWDLSRSLNLDFNAVNNAYIDEPFGRLDTKAKRDTVRKNFMKGGRNTLYQQKGIVSYAFPLNKFPLTDWINARYSYSTNYNWIGASLLARNLGNIIENGQQNNLNAEFDLTRLYSKSKWISSLDMPRSAAPPPAPAQQPGARTAIPDPMANLPSREEAIKGLKGHKKRLALRKWRRQRREARRAQKLLNANSMVEPPGAIVKTGGKLVTMVKTVSVNYSANFSTRVPGYMDSTKALGQNWNSMQPGLDFVFGKQPGIDWLERKARQGLISRDSTFNLMFRQTFEQQMGVTARVEPFREFIVDLNIDKSFTKEYTELFKDTTGTGNNFGHLSPYAGGGFSVSYISFKTLFGSYNPTQISETFKEFQSNRLVISERLARSNPYQNGQKTADGYYVGYGRYAQDVIIPAFIAAYTGKDPNSVSLLKQSNSNIKSNPFSGIKPLPNWRVTYTGLSRMIGLTDIFSNISVSHGYTGKLSMNSYTSALLYSDPLRYGAPGFIDTVSGNFVPYFLVPNLTIQESFAPLIGFDVTTITQLNLKFEFLKSRQLSMSLIDYQLSEVRSTQWNFGFSWRKRGLNLPFKLPGMKEKRLENDLNITFDLSMRDDTQSNSTLDQNAAYSTGGQKVIKIQPSIDYILNNRINVKLYFDQQRVIPYISTSAPTTNTRGGLQIRISLAP